jgi:hypothetical protein
MAHIVFASPRVVHSSQERLGMVREFLNELLPFWGDTIASVISRTPGVFGQVLTTSDKVLLRLAYHAYVHSLAEQGLIPQPARFAVSTLRSKNDLWMTSHFPCFVAWAADKSLVDGVFAVVSVQARNRPAQAKSGK